MSASSETWREAFQASPAVYAPFSPERLAGFIREFNIPPERLTSWLEMPLLAGTFRVRIAVTLTGSQIRIRLSNEEGTNPLALAAASVGIAADGFEARPGSLNVLTFGGGRGATIPAGAPLLSDPVDMAVATGTELVVSVHSVEGVRIQPQGGATIVFSEGDQTMANQVAKPAVLNGRAIVTGASVLVARPASVIVAFGDSITDGNREPGVLRGWPEQLARRLMARADGGNYAVVNAGIGGNRLLTPGWGKAGLARLDRDALRIEGLSHLIVLEGTNDIGAADRPSFGEERAVISGDIIAGYRQIIARAHAHGAKVIFGTLLPTGGSFAHASPAKDAMREDVNRWIRTSGEPDGIIDFERITADAHDPAKLKEEFDSGDHLHPSDAGYKAMGDGIDLGLFP